MRWHRRCSPCPSRLRRAALRAAAACGAVDCERKDQGGRRHVCEVTRTTPKPQRWTPSTRYLSEETRGREREMASVGQFEHWQSKGGDQHHFIVSSRASQPNGWCTSCLLDLGELFARIVHCMNAGCVYVKIHSTRMYRIHSALVCRGSMRRRSVGG